MIIMEVFSISEVRPNYYVVKRKTGEIGEIIGTPGIRGSKYGGFKIILSTFPENLLRYNYYGSYKEKIYTAGMLFPTFRVFTSHEDLLQLYPEYAI